jgi:hypothetical protein
VESPTGTKEVVVERFITLIVGGWFLSFVILIVVVSLFLYAFRWFWLGRVDIQRERNYRCELNETQEGRCQFLVASCDTAAMLEPVYESFDYVAELVPLAVIAASAAVATRRDDRLGACSADVLPQRIAVISLVGNHMLGFEAFQQYVGARDVMAFPFGQMQLNRLALAVDRDVDLGAETPTGAPQPLGFLPPFAPAACWWARTIVESSNRFANWASPPSASSNRPQTPLLHQR